MGAYHQVGYDSENLLFTEGLEQLSGAILSPLNYDPASVANQVKKLSDRVGFRTILDPHLYRPKSGRGCLPSWRYYPKDVDTTDFNQQWWSNVIDQLAIDAQELGVSSVASPAMIPRTFSDDYYLDLNSYGSELESIVAGTSVSAMQTVVAQISDLSSFERTMTIASITSESKVPEVMLVFISDREPRRELADPQEIKGAMKLIETLEAAGQRVTVAWSSSDMLLWKSAGATNCATGKFFNLRRFTASRFDQPDNGGGGQLPYWFEESLLGFLRQSDLLRIEAKGMFSNASTGNPFSQPILDSIRAGKPWLALSWRHFLWWFSDAEQRITGQISDPAVLVDSADTAWKSLEVSKPPVYMEERQNDGAWVREWRRAVAELRYWES